MHNIWLVVMVKKNAVSVTFVVLASKNLKRYSICVNIDLCCVVPYSCNILLSGVVVSLLQSKFTSS